LDKRKNPKFRQNISVTHKTDSSGSFFLLTLCR